MKTVKAWAVKTKRGNIVPRSCRLIRSDCANSFLWAYGDTVVRVEIREIKPKRERK